MRNLSHKVVEKNRTYILCSITYFQKIAPFIRYGIKVL